MVSIVSVFIFNILNVNLWVRDWTITISIDVSSFKQSKPAPWYSQRTAHHTYTNLGRVNFTKPLILIQDEIRHFCHPDTDWNRKWWVYNLFSFTPGKEYAFSNSDFAHDSCFVTTFADKLLETVLKNSRITRNGNLRMATASCQVLLL